MTWLDLGRSNIGSLDLHCSAFPHTNSGNENIPKRGLQCVLPMEVSSFPLGKASSGLNRHRQRRPRVASTTTMPNMTAKKHNVLQAAKGNTQKYRDCSPKSNENARSLPALSTDPTKQGEYRVDEHISEGAIQCANKTHREAGTVQAGSCWYGDCIFESSGTYSETDDDDYSTTDDSDECAVSDGNLNIAAEGPTQTLVLSNYKKGPAFHPLEDVPALGENYKWGKQKNAKQMVVTQKSLLTSSIGNVDSIPSRCVSVQDQESIPEDFVRLIKDKEKKRLYHKGLNQRFADEVTVSSDGYHVRGW